MPFLKKWGFGWFCFAAIKPGHWSTPSATYLLKLFYVFQTFKFKSADVLSFKPTSHLLTHMFLQIYLFEALVFLAMGKAQHLYHCKCNYGKITMAICRLPVHQIILVYLCLKQLFTELEILNQHWTSEKHSAVYPSIIQ